MLIIELHKQSEVYLQTVSLVEQFGHGASMMGSVLALAKSAHGEEILAFKARFL